MSEGIVDEYTLCEKLGAQAARDDVLNSHWENWIQWKDFKKIADSGFNHVRIPIGYWAYDNSDSPYSDGAAPYIDAAIDWARSVGLKVIIDLHGAPLSQNGFDNSGQRVDKPGKPGWQQGDSVQKTLAVLEKIQNKYGAGKYDDVIAGIELLNEPLTPELDLPQYKQFVRDGFAQQRQSSQSRVMIFSDGFQEPSSWNHFLTPSDNNAQNVAVDHHEYQVFTPEFVSMEPWQHRQYVCNNAHTYSNADKWTFVGEWSAAMTDCAAALNGYGKGARYDGTYPESWFVKSCDGVNFMETWSQQFKDDTRGYIEAQMEAFEAKTQGWVSSSTPYHLVLSSNMLRQTFWTWRTEASPEWDAQRLIDAGIFPQPLTDRKFGQICSNV